MFNARRWVLSGSVVVALTIGTACLAQAQGRPREPMTALAYRKSLMGELQANVGALTAVRAGEVGEAGHVAARAEIIHLLAHMTEDAFPAGSGGGDSRALPSIWTEPEAFAERVHALQAAADQLVAASESGNAEGIAAAQMAVQQSCGGCHTQFRAPAQ